jgi:hypothetical protein
MYYWVLCPNKTHVISEYAELLPISPSLFNDQKSDYQSLPPEEESNLSVLERAMIDNMPESEVRKMGL